MSAEPPEQLLDAFKAAALSVTKLYKISASAQTKARTDGYQDCLDDLQSFLDRENIGLGDGEGRRVRRWLTDRLEGRDGVPQSMESEDEVEKAETTASSPETHRSTSATQLPALRNEATMRDSAPPVVQPVTTIAEEPEPEIVVPTQETFNFQSSHPYPPYLNLANLDLSDSHSATAAPVSRSSRTRHGNGARTNSRSASHLGRGAGQKRKINFAEIFDLGSLGSGKDPFGNGGKRSRHT
ncbi:hypothetical protein QBC33DRAFT_501258 [Phialemonium atrogriseum]|uniref:Uncharacterized protein n=1 Tax=Phialemonium atrogriseum TaxID=1093897 RepID=A0AAJ0FHP4_9PEZI|nr:uncharacterized protein QBC33DRAFT_501258 [Phialemonium atrogriseum]KAK1762389.1 hypothetical protein QBC33DRAFT_501258 [Phialemonium atrogriseum]